MECRHTNNGYIRSGHFPAPRSKKSGESSHRGVAQVLSVGQRGELLVAERLLEQGWSVALPFDTTTFDLVGVKGDRRVLLQVKSTLHKHDYENTTPHYQFQLAKGKSYKHKYQKGELDFFICVALDARRFWVFPFGELDQFTVKVYDSNSRFREYEGAWELLEK